MTTPTDLPADQRAVLELVLSRGRNYDEIARLLSIDRAGVRERALAALDALGPQTGLPVERRALITDYLLGQLPDAVAEQLRRRLASDPADRAWARVVAGELAELAPGPLPAIPPPEAAGPDGDGGGTRADAAREADRPPAPAPPSRPAADPGAEAPRRSSRTGGAILLGLATLAVAALVIVVIVVTGGGGGSKHNASTPSTAAPSTGTSGSAGTPVNLGTTKLSAVSPGSKAQGAAEAVRESGQNFLLVIAVGLAPNKGNYYAVWLSNGPTQNELVGFDRQAVTSNGRLEALAPLRANARSYQKLILTLQPGSAPPTTGPYPTKPGPTVLTGNFTMK